MYIYWDHTITHMDSKVILMIVPSSVGAAAYANNPSRIRRLVIGLEKCSCHFIHKSPPTIIKSDCRGEV